MEKLCRNCEKKLGKFWNSFWKTFKIIGENVKIYKEIIENFEKILEEFWKIFKMWKTLEEILEQLF